MAQRLTKKRLSWLVFSATCLVIISGLLEVAKGQYLSDEDEFQQQQQQQQVAANRRVRRQQGGRIQVPPVAGQVDIKVTGPSVQGNAQAASAMSLASSLASDAQAGPNENDQQQVKPAKISGNSRPTTAAATQTGGARPSLEENLPEEWTTRPVQRKQKKPRVRPTSRPAYEDAEDDDHDHDEYEPEESRRRPLSSAGGSEYDDEYCDDDYGHPMLRPMRQMTRMMGGVFDQMQSMASGGFVGNFPAGGNMAMASSMGDSDGYSRMSSLVNNNGRTRGIVSETRNGRTKTRRIGDGANEQEEDSDEE